MKSALCICAGLLALAATSATSRAADLALKAPPLAAPPVAFTWSGCHVGGHLGAAISQDRTGNFFGATTDFSSTGFIGGGQVGCDYQFASRWVVGAEGRAAWSSLTNTRAGEVRNLITGVVLPGQFTTRNDFLATATARVGYAFADRWLVFVRGGAAWTHEKLDTAFTRLTGIAVDPSETTTRGGWTAGTGVDWAFAPHWSASLEYNYHDFGDRRSTQTDSGGTVLTIASFKDRIHTVTAGIDYHF